MMTLVTTRSTTAVRPSARRAVAALVLSLGLLGACGTPDSSADDPCAGRPVAPAFDPATRITDASGLAVRIVGGAAVVTVAEPFPGGPPTTVVLTRCGAPDPGLPPELASAPRLATPVRTLVSASTTHLPMLTDLGRIDVLAAVGDDAGLVSAPVRAAVADGRVGVVARGGSTDVESVLGLSPDAVVTAGLDDAAYGRLEATGVTVVPDADWLERTPLGRAEWIKLFGLLTGEERRATAVFDGIRRDYGAVRDRLAGVAPTPVVSGQLASGAVDVPSGGSYVGALLRDAGGAWAYADRPETGSLRLSLEEVLTRAGDAPVWLTTATAWTTRDDARRADPRHGLLAAMRPGGRAWTASLARTPEGGNDWFERGVTRPDLALADVAAILHPDRFPEHPFTFFRPLEGP